MLHVQYSQIASQVITVILGKLWQNVAIDLMMWGGNQYLMTVDSRSKFIEVDHLVAATLDAVTECLKSHFAHYGMPDVIASDNRTKLISYHFKKF